MSVMGKIDFTSMDTGNNITDVINNARTQIKGILTDHTATAGYAFQSVATQLGTSTGFRGIDENGLQFLINAINTYCDNVTKIVNNFREDANIDVAFKGFVATEIKEFVVETKKLLIAYVNNIKRDSEEAKRIFAEYYNRTEHVGGDVNIGSQEIADSAKKITFEEGTGGN